MLIAQIHRLNIKLDTFYAQTRNLFGQYGSFVSLARTSIGRHAALNYELRKGLIYKLEYNDLSLLRCLCRLLI